MIKIFIVLISLSFNLKFILTYISIVALFFIFFALFLIKNSS
ncbi:hypothetical protein AWRIB429_0706 [Oenococcus oeni AWRIB429]|uniref:Uncharacterized protein n=1 Tax=Oenococcus oeni AWRIB429 TaxID=655225 RepID=D3L8M6_OENOE|nr:hypothetical protein AWRIB429_0706 [Oenococcus oeni AWRIB429]